MVQVNPGEDLREWAAFAHAQPDAQSGLTHGTVSRRARVQKSKLGSCHDLQSLQPTHPQPDLQIQDLLRAPSVGVWHEMRSDQTKERETQMPKVSLASPEAKLKPERYRAHMMWGANYPRYGG